MEETRIIDAEDLLYRSANKPKIAVAVLQAFLECGPSTLELLQAAVKGHDWNQMRAKAHAIKGLLLDIGCKPGSEVANQLEHTGDSSLEGVDNLVVQLNSMVTLVVKEADRLKTEFQAR